MYIITYIIQARFKLVQKFAVEFTGTFLLVLTIGCSVCDSIL